METASQWSSFKPLWLLRNPHVQTVLGHWLSGPRFCYPTQKYRVPLSDGDQLVMHDSVPPEWQPGDRIAVLVHGLGGCHDSGHLRRLARQFYQRQVRAIRLDLRGCGAGIGLARKSYHAGRSEDLLAVLQTLQQWHPQSPVTLIGISLGGNTVLMLAGEGVEKPCPNLDRVIALAPPVDMHRCSAMIASPRNRMYDRYFVKLLINQVQARALLFPDLPRVSFPRRMSIRLFDDLVTAPLNGFLNADDYYTKAAASNVIASISLPTLVLVARDDPFIAVEPFEHLSWPEAVQIAIIEHGGHLGFLGSDGNGGHRWAETRIVDWALSPLS